MTTSDYLEQLQQDKEDLVDNLTTKGITGLTGNETFTELVPEVLNIQSGGIPSITSLSQINSYIQSMLSDFTSYKNNEFNNRDVYTTNSITLYTPDIDYTKYIIEKFSGGYRIVWIPEANIVAQIDTTNALNVNSGYRVRSSPYSETKIIDNLQMWLEVAGFTGNLGYYYSNGFATIQEIIQAISSPNGSITYTKWTTGNTISIVDDTPYIVPYSNITIYDNRGGTSILLTTKVISKNETIEVIPSE